MEENWRLKTCLVLQSFVPLFCLLLIKYMHFDMFRLIIAFSQKLAQNGIRAFSCAYHHDMFWNAIISFICVTWIVITAIVMSAYNSMQKSGFRSAGEKIMVNEEQKDAGVSFLVSFVLPLLIDDVCTLRDFIFFAALIIIIIALLIKTNLFYQNPVLILLGYRVFKFKFVNPAQDVSSVADREVIGITKRVAISEEAVVKRKYIADNVFMLYND